MYDESVLKRNVIQGVQDSICQAMPLICSWNQHATVQDLVFHATIPTKLQNGSHLGDGTRNCKKPKSLRGNRKSKRPPWCTSKVIENTLHAFTAQSKCRNHTYGDDTTSQTSQKLKFERFARRKLNLHIIFRYRLIFMFMPCRIARHTDMFLLKGASRRYIINQRHLNFASFPPINAYRPGSQRPRRSGKSAPNPFPPQKWSSKLNHGTIPNTHRPRNRSSRNWSKTTPLKRTSITLTWATPPSEHLASLRAKN